MMQKPKPPCGKECAERYADDSGTCHATCERYKEYCNLNELYKSEVMKMRSFYNDKHWYQTCNGWWRRK